jgi:hypothetical protein
MLKQADDLAFGKKSEMSLHKKIEKLVGDEIEWKGGMEVFDYCNRGKTIYAELKSRRIKHDDYATALIGLNKVEACTNPDVDYYFVYSYLDGVYYIKYDKTVFSTFEVDTSYQRSDRGDCLNKPSAVVYVPVEKLKRFECKSE